MALMLMAAFVVVSQLKINVMNAYAGSLAWSNFFSRLTHSHPGPGGLAGVQCRHRAAPHGAWDLQAAGGNTWRVFDHRHGLAVGDLRGSLHQQAVRPLPARHRVQAGASLRHQPGRHRRDVLAAGLALACLLGHFGEEAAALSTFLAMAVAFIAAPLIAWATKGQYYLARKPRKSWQARGSHRLFHLRESVRAGRHGVLSRLSGANLLPVLLAGRQMS
jgi:hypothetical protein